MAEDFGPEVFAGASSRDFLKKKKDGFAGFGGEGKGLIVVGLPRDSSKLGRGVFLRTAGHKRKEEKREKKFHVTGDGTNKRRTLFPGDILLFSRPASGAKMVFRLVIFLWDDEGCVGRCGDGRLRHG